MPLHSELYVGGRESIILMLCGGHNSPNFPTGGLPKTRETGPIVPHIQFSTKGTSSNFECVKLTSSNQLEDGEKHGDGRLRS